MPLRPSLQALLLTAGLWRGCIAMSVASRSASATQMNATAQLNSSRFLNIQLPFFSSTNVTEKPVEQPEAHRVKIQDVSVHAEMSTFNTIMVNVELNDTSHDMDVYCRAYPYDAERKKRPTPSVHFMSCSKCNVGTTYGCKGNCDVQIKPVHGNKKYSIWCVTKSQPQLMEYWPEDEDIFPQDIAGVPWMTARALPAGEHTVLGVENFFTGGLMVIYIWWSHVSKGTSCISASALIVVIGLFCGWFLKFVFLRDMDFNFNMFSFYLLPMVIFSAGFRLKGNDMLKRFAHIGFLGLFGTICLGMSLFFVAGQVTHLPYRERLILAFSLCATDTIAAIGFVPQSVGVSHSVVLGEGVLNDITSVLISQTLVGHLRDIHTVSFRLLLEQFVFLAVASLSCGLVFGFFITQMQKKMAIFQSDAIRSAAMVLGMNYSCYTLAEMCGVSGILALFTSAIITGRYAWPEFPTDTQRMSNELAEALGVIADGMVYGQLGLTSWTYIKELASTSLFEMAVPAVVIALAMMALRITVVFIANEGISQLRGDGHVLSNSEAALVALGGAMRGGVAYSIVLRSMPPSGLRTGTESDLLSMTNKIVIFNTIVFGACVPYIVQRLTKNIKGSTGLEAIRTTARQPSMQSWAPVGSPVSSSSRAAP